MSEWQFFSFQTFAYMPLALTRKHNGRWPSPFTFLSAVFNCQISALELFLQTHTGVKKKKKATHSLASVDAFTALKYESTSVSLKDWTYGKRLLMNNYQKQPKTAWYPKISPS